jgi:predicted acetyltransferase
MKYNFYDTVDNIISKNVYDKLYNILYNFYNKNNPDFIKEETKIHVDTAYKNWVNVITSTPNYHIMVVNDNDKVIGFVAFMYDKEMLCLSEIQIIDECQNKGLLKDILKNVINNTDKNKYKKVYGTINKNNIHSQEVFKHIGLVNRENNIYVISLNNLIKWINKNNL